MEKNGINIQTDKTGCRNVSRTEEERLEYRFVFSI
jgi:hypothetical protein